MYIVAIAWLYVTILMAATERSFTAGVMTFIFYGVLPLALLLWLVGTPTRRKLRRRRAAESAAASAARTDVALDSGPLQDANTQSGDRGAAPPPVAAVQDRDPR